MGKLAVQALTRPYGPAHEDDPCPRTTSTASAARIPTASSTADGAPVTSRSAATTARPSTGCCIATPARPASPSSRAPRCSTPSSLMRRCSRSSSTSPTAAASARPPGWWASVRTPSRDWPCSPVATPRPPTTSSWAFPPCTREVQFDEKWAFVGKKQANCDPDDPADDHCGDYWDYVAYDPEHRLVLIVVPGARSIENAEITVEETKARLGDEPLLMTSDEFAAYATALETTFGAPAPPPEKRGPGRPRVVPE